MLSEVLFVISTFLAHNNLAATTFYVESVHQRQVTWAGFLRASQPGSGGDVDDDEFGILLQPTSGPVIQQANSTAASRR